MSVMVATEPLRSGKGNPKALAQSIARALEDEPTIELHAIGPDSINNSVKAMAIARAYLAEYDLDLVVQPSFMMLPNRNRPGEEITGIRFVLERKELR